MKVGDNIDLPTTPKQEIVTVYDLDGVEHKMTRLNANDMVQHLGWAWRVAKPLVPAAQKVVVLVSKKAAPVTPDASEEVDLSSMDASQLRAFAKAHFGMEFGEEVEASAILDAIIVEQQ